MTDKELVKQAFNALNKMTDLFPDASGGHSQEAEDACNAALVVMADLAASLQKPEKTNQCAETCERAKLCAVCGVSLNQDAVAWVYTNAQGKTVIVESDVPPYDDAVPLFKSESQAEQKPWVWLTDGEVSKLIDNEIGFNSCCGWEHEYTRAVEAKIKEKNE